MGEKGAIERPGIETEVRDLAKVHSYLQSAGMWEGKDGRDRDV